MSRITNGLFLLAIFGAICGVSAGIIFGGCTGLFFAIVGITSIQAAIVYVLYGCVVGALVGLLPGILYGLTSYYITEQWHWSVDGGFWAGVGYLLLTSLTKAQFVGQAFLFCIVCGFLTGAFNGAFPDWWGRKLHKDAKALLRQTN